jgi:hypothetical protein
MTLRGRFDRVNQAAGTSASPPGGVRQSVAPSPGAFNFAMAVLLDGAPSGRAALSRKYLRPELDIVALDVRIGARSAHSS